MMRLIYHVLFFLSGYAPAHYGSRDHLRDVGQVQTLNEARELCWSWVGCVCPTSVVMSQ